MPDRASVQAHMKDSCGVEISVTRGKLHHADLERGASRIGEVFVPHFGAVWRTCLAGRGIY